MINANYIFAQVPKTYNSTLFDISFEYPSDWYVPPSLLADNSSLINEPNDERNLFLSDPRIIDLGLMSYAQIAQICPSSPNVTANGNCLQSGKDGDTVLVEQYYLGGFNSSPSLEEYTDYNIKRIKEDFANFTITSSSSANFAGLPAHQVEYMFKDGDTERKRIEIWTNQNRSGYNIAYIPASPGQQGFSDEVQQIIKSFKINKERYYS
ncbi:MAG: hypothetical protein M3M88_05015 [Thermoproteota archaeon]|nr:hypothetical protein [Thermoproteota archaeon]